MQTEIKDYISDTIQRINKKQWLIPPSTIEDGKRFSCGDSDLLFKFCMDNGVVPALSRNMNCLCPVIRKGSHRWRFSCENDPSSFVGFRVLDHVVFFRDINPPKKIVLAVGQPYFQSLDKSNEWIEKLTQWGPERGLRVILDNGPGASWWNPGEGKIPQLGHCITIQFWNDSKRTI